MRKNLIRVWQYFKQSKLALVFALVSSFIVATTDAALLKGLQFVMDNILIKKDMSLLVYTSFSIIGVFAFRGFFRFMQLYMLRVLAYKATRVIREDLYEKLIRFPMSYFDNSGTGEMMSRLINDIGKVQAAIPSAVKLFKEMFRVIFIGSFVIYTHAKLGLIGFTVFPLMGIIINFAGKKTKKYSRKSQERMGLLANAMQETFTGVRVVKAFVTEDKEVQTFKEKSYNEMVYQVKRIFILAISSPFMEMLAGFALAGLIYIGGAMIANEVLTIGEFTSFFAAFVMIMEPIKKLNVELNNVQTAVAASERIFNVIDKRNEILDNDGKLPCDANNKLIEFKDVHFSYKDGGENVLNGINLNIKPGTTVALVGSSGAGKSTFVNLIPRFYDIQSGGLFIDGVNIKDYQVYDLRRNIGIVSQEPFLFNETIAYNIAYGKDDATREQIEKAAEDAYALGFINEMPKGLDTMIGERGDRLSGGQKQRLTIARALLKNPPILILDEATSSLDTESEKIVQKALNNLMKGRTSFVIAHRLSTILDADMIVVLDKGKVVDTGTHDELLGSCALYTRLYNMQFRAGEENI
jgi:subfamily B ATP-binding cassette protein MsbA